MHTPPNIVIIGLSGHASVIVDIVEREGKYRLAGLIAAERGMETAFGYPILGVDEVLPDLVAQYNLVGGVIAIGDNWQRHRVAQKIRALLPGFVFVKAVHPSAQLARGVTMGAGSVVMAGAVINSGCDVGEFCIVNTRSALDHDSHMADFCSLAPGATTGGGVRIGAFSAVSLGANVIHGCSIGQHTVIGAGALVLQDVPDCCVAYGVPARVIRARTIGEGYL